MKAFVDFKASMERKWLGNQILKNRLKYNWGTEYVDGVHVFKEKFQVWPGDNLNIRKITSLFGIAGIVKNSPKNGITSIYLTFDPFKKENTLQELDNFVLANKVNSFMELGKEYRFNLNVTDNADPLKFSEYSKQNILDYVDANIGTLLDSIYTETSSYSATLDAIGKYVLLDDEGLFEISVINAYVTPVEQTRTTGGESNETIKYYTSAISLEYRVKRVLDIDSDSQFISRLKSENDQLKQSKVLGLASADDEGFSSFTKPIKTDTFWYKSRLRVETTDIALLPQSKFADLILATLDTGYTKKKTKWYKKVITMLVIIVAIVLAIPSGGSSLAIVAAASTAAALSATLLSMYWAKQGEFGAAEFSGGLAKFAGIVSLVAGITVILQNIAKAGLQGAAQAAGATTTTQVVRAASAEAALASVSTSGTTLLSTVTELSTGQFVVEVTTISFQNIASSALKILKFFNSRREKNKVRQLNDLQEEITQQEEELERLQDRELHLGIEDIKWYSSPLKGDNMQFEIDHLYDGSKMNIQKPSFYPANGLNIRT